MLPELFDENVEDDDFEALFETLKTREFHDYKIHFPHESENSIDDDSNDTVSDAKIISNIHIDEENTINHIVPYDIINILEEMICSIEYSFSIHFTLLHTLNNNYVESHSNESDIPIEIPKSDFSINNDDPEDFNSILSADIDEIDLTLLPSYLSINHNSSSFYIEDNDNEEAHSFFHSRIESDIPSHTTTTSKIHLSDDINTSSLTKSITLNTNINSDSIVTSHVPIMSMSNNKNSIDDTIEVTNNITTLSSHINYKSRRKKNREELHRYLSAIKIQSIYRRYICMREYRQLHKQQQIKLLNPAYNYDIDTSIVELKSNNDFSHTPVVLESSHISTSSISSNDPHQLMADERGETVESSNIHVPSLTIANTTSNTTTTTTTTTTTDIDSCVVLNRATLLDIVENKSVYNDDDSLNDTATIIATITSEVISPSVTKMLSDLKDEMDEVEEEEEEDVEYSGIHVLNDEEEYYMYYCPMSTTTTSTTTTTTSMMSSNHHYTPYDSYQDSIYIDSTLISNNSNNNNSGSSMKNQYKETLLYTSSTEEDIPMLMTIWRKDVARLLSTMKPTAPPSSSSSSSSSSGQSQSDISSSLSYLFPIRSPSASNPCTCTHSNIYYLGNQTWYNELLRILYLQSNSVNNLSQIISMMSSNHPPSIAANLSKSLLQTSKDSPPPPTSTLSLQPIYLRQLLLQSLFPYTPSINDINTMNRLGLDIDSLDRIDTLALSVEDLSSVTFLSICHHLIKLELNVNKLRSLHGLERLINLRYLTIKDNLLTSLEPLHSCLLLQHLEVDVNRISTIPETFSLYNLITLTINHNILSEFPKLHCPYLCHLELHHNRITTLDTLSECTVPSLQYLDVSNNNLTYVNGEILSRKCLLLHTLILSHNQLQEVPSNLYLYHLSILWLSGNRITSLCPWIPPSYMVNLDHIFFPPTTTTTNNHTVISTVSNNSMVQSITDLTHDRPRAMKEGNDSNTQSTDIHWPIYLPQLTSLHIQDNQLKTIDIGVLSTFISLKYLDLSFNKLHDKCDLYGLILGVSSTRLEKIQLYENRIYQYYHAIETCRQQNIQVSAAVEDELNDDDTRSNDNSNNMHGNDVIGMPTSNSNNKKGTNVSQLVVVYNELINMLRLAHPHLIEVSDYKCSPYYLSTLLSAPEIYHTSDPLHLQYISKYLETQKMKLYQNSLRYQYRYPCTCMISTRYTLVSEKIQSVLICYDYLSKTNDTNEVWSRISSIIDTLYTHYQQLPSHIEQLQHVLESCQQKQTKEKNIMKEVWTNSHSQVEVTAENTCDYKCLLYHQDIISKYDTLLHTLPYFTTTPEANNNNNNNNNNTSNSERKDDNNDHTLHDCITSLKNAVLLKDHHSKSSSLLQSYRTQLYFYICKVQAICRGYLTRKRIHAVFQQTKYIDPELDALFQSSGIGEGEGEDMNLDDFLAFTADAMIDDDDDSNMMNQYQYPLSSDTAHSNNIVTIRGNMKAFCKDKEEEEDDEENDIYASSMNSTTFVYGDHKRVKKKNVATIYNEKEGVLAFSHTQNGVHHNNWMHDISDSMNSTQQPSNANLDKVGKVRGTTLDTALLTEGYIQHTDDSTTSSDHRPSTANSQTSALTEYTSTHVDMIKTQLDATTTTHNTTPYNTTTTLQSHTYYPNDLAALLHSHHGITAGVHSQVYNHMASRETAETAEIEAFAQDWNIKDPKLIATLMKRNKKMKKFENAKMNREKEKDPEYRLNKFLKHTHHIATTTTSTTAVATSQDMMINNDSNTTSNNESKNTITSKFAKRLGLPVWLMKPPS